MTPTKFSTLTNQEVMEKLTELTAKRENGICYFTDPEECQEAPCTSEERIDGKRGYFSIHDMPNQ